MNDYLLKLAAATIVLEELNKDASLSNEVTGVAKKVKKSKALSKVLVGLAIAAGLGAAGSIPLPVNRGSVFGADITQNKSLFDMLFGGEGSINISEMLRGRGSSADRTA